MVDWFNPDEIDAVAWSLHLADKHFHSDFQIRNKTARAVTSLERDFRKRIDQLPEGDRSELNEQLAKRTESEWKQEVEAARLLAKQKGIDQAAIDRAVEAVR